MAETTAKSPSQENYLEKLLELGQLMNSTLELKQVLDIAMEQVIKFVGAERGFILLVDVATGKVWGEAMYQIDRAALEAAFSGREGGNQAEISKTIVESVLTTRQPVISYNAMEDPRFASRQSVQFHNLRSVLCVPLLVRDKLLGVIYLDNRLKTGVFSEEHLQMLQAFSNQAAIALENARLYENLRRSLEERLRLQDELHKQETRRLAMEEANRLKSDFIGFVAHELRNPLTTIRGYVQTILADTDHTLDEETKQEFYRAIEADADRLLDMINELLDVARLEAGRPLTLAIREVDIRAVLERLVNRYRYYKFYTDRHQLVLDVADDVPNTIEADEDKLTMIFSNLISNALKYSPQGGEVRITARKEEDALVVRVKDHGVGMTQEECARLFRPYERLEREEIRNIQGTGLGLYLVKHLVDLHKGTISVESAPGQGSTFTVRLPLQANQVS
ncbi:MAG TPA: GAF domain-containing sensor histidine kinase [Chthonomonas sp.]|uniref:GAF domain-containing sensor histidine kinase n=1 Tax=Chthonomonas sp. TaxID=2282153 RepID=UPI002B4AFA2F|nr:GAF domain-containing sensor histidine kinase [Chthonomonas sp.]HLI49082.1 GAF domain-containing sensor histidine kinase [Chthonomonas sp.]